MDESNRQEKGLISDNDSSLLLLVKAKRIFTAINKITDFIEPQEALRQRMRDTGCDLLATTLSFISVESSKLSKIIKDLYDLMNSIMSYTDVLMMSGLLSETNTGIIKDEILSFKNRVDEYSSSRSHLVPIEHLFEDGDTSASLFFQTSASRGLPSPREMSSIELSKPNVRNASPLPQIPQGEIGQKDKRKSAIFDYIRKRGAATVRDLMPVIKGCSEKTIQRELAALVGSGALRKEGERRWSKYFLARTL